MKICAICGKPLDSGVVVHSECVPKWIAVEDSVPEPAKYVLTVNKYNSYRVAKYVHDEKRFAFPHSELVTHWMPLPEPPRGGLTDD